jgi:hypothetical protein
MQISNNRFKQVGSDLQECWVWGIDLYTRKNILLSLPEGYSDELKYSFIQNIIIRTVNKFYLVKQIE